VKAESATVKCPV